MQKYFNEGDKVKIIEMPTDGKHLINHIGTVIKCGGTCEKDEIGLKLKNGDILFVKEHQLIKI